MAVYQQSLIIFQLCLERLERLQKTAKQIEEISEMTSNQADDESGEWMMLCRERVTASSFGDIARRRTLSSLAPVVTKLLYSKHFITPAMALIMNLLFVKHTLPSNVNTTEWYL